MDGFKRGGQNFGGHGGPGGPGGMRGGPSSEVGTIN